MCDVAELLYITQYMYAHVYACTVGLGLRVAVLGRCGVQGVRAVGYSASVGEPANQGLGLDGNALCMTMSR